MPPLYKPSELILEFYYMSNGLIFQVNQFELMQESAKIMRFWFNVTLGIVMYLFFC